MKLLKLISLLLMITVMNSYSYSQGIKSSSEKNILIYNFTTSDNYKKIRDNKKNNQFYSTIIPEAIGKNLQNSGNYTIHRETGPFSIEPDFKDSSEKEKYITKLIVLGSKYNSGYIITGSFTVKNIRISIRVTVFNITSKEIKVIDQESSELGIQFTDTTDTLTQKISEYIKNLDEKNKFILKKSPFIALYKPFSIITTGVDGGYIVIYGEWASVYNNTPYLAPFIDFDLTEHFSLSLKYTSIQTDSDDKETSAYSQIQIKSGGLSLCYTYLFNPYIGFTFSTGGGMTKTVIEINPEQPFVNSLSEKKSTDPNIDISAYIVYNLASLTLKTGILYKRILFKDEPMDIGGCFASAGVNF